MATSTLAESEKTATPTPAGGESCPNCGSVEPWGQSSWCPACGYYPALGGTSLRSADEVDAETAHAAWENNHQAPANLIEAIPAWAWLAMAGSFLIFLGNVGLQIFVPLKASHRTLFKLLEFSVGSIVAGVSHGTAYLFAAYKSDKFGPFDFFMRPIEIWKPTFQKLPEGNRRVCSMTWGITAVFASIFLLGGFDLNALFEEDWGFEDRKKTNLVQETVKQTRKKGKGDEDLEGAIKEFTGEGEPGDEPPKLLETRCVIVGYIKSEKGDLEALVLASAPQGRLAYVGLLSQADIPEEYRAEVLTELQEVKQLKSCYIKQDVPLNKATWVEPRILCLVEHKSWTTQYRLQQPKFLELVDPEKEAEEKAKAEKTKGSKDAD